MTHTRAVDASEYNDSESDHMTDGISGADRGLLSGS